MAKKPKIPAAVSTRNGDDGYAKIDQYNADTVKRIASRYHDVLTDLGEDPTREGLVKTPERVAKALQFLTHGNNLDPAGILRSAMFKEEYQQMVIVKDIEVYSLCEHHMLPFFGKAHVAYIPNGHIVGLSKIPRVVDAFRAQAAGAGAAHGRNPQLHPGNAEAAGRRGGHRGAAFVHGHARHSEAAFDRNDVRVHGRIPAGPHARGVYPAHIQARRLKPV